MIRDSLFLKKKKNLLCHVPPSTDQRFRIISLVHYLLRFILQIAYSFFCNLQPAALVQRSGMNQLDCPCFTSVGVSDSEFCCDPDLSAHYLHSYI